MPSAAVYGSTLDRSLLNSPQARLPPIRDLFPELEVGQQRRSLSTEGPHDWQRHASISVTTKRASTTRPTTRRPTNIPFTDAAKPAFDQTKTTPTVSMSSLGDRASWCLHNSFYEESDPNTQLSRHARPSIPISPAPTSTTWDRASSMAPLATATVSPSVLSSTPTLINHTPEPRPAVPEAAHICSKKIKGVRCECRKCAANRSHHNERQGRSRGLQRLWTERIEALLRRIAAHRGMNDWRNPMSDSFVWPNTGMFTGASGIGEQNTKRMIKGLSRGYDSVDGPVAEERIRNSLSEASISVLTMPVLKTVADLLEAEASTGRVDPDAWRNNIMAALDSAPPLEPWAYQRLPPPSDAVERATKRPKLSRSGAHPGSH